MSEKTAREDKYFMCENAKQMLHAFAINYDVSTKESRASGLSEILVQLRSLLPEKRNSLSPGNVGEDNGWNAYHDEMMRRLT